MLRRRVWAQLCRPLVKPFLFQRFRHTGRTPWRKDTTPGPSVFVEENFAKHTLFVFDVGRRAIKFSLIGLLSLGVTAAVIYEGAHMWVEYVELAPKIDEEEKKWEWNVEADNWTGNPTNGGTDPGLGFKGRHTVRAAWMAYNWGVGHSAAVIGSNTTRGEGLTGSGGLKVIDARLQRTEDFLRTAVSIAENRSSHGQLHSHTMAELLARHANILERLGTESLSESKAQYERVWTILSGRGIKAAHIAVRLGDINSRLGQMNDARVWWSKAIQITSNDPGTGTADSVDVLPAPQSPAAQRLLLNTVVSLSASYAWSGELQLAQSIGEAALNMLRSIRPPESSASASPQQALHALYLLQRSSLLSIHLAEILHARQQPSALSIQWLTSAAESSERVARMLTGIPPFSSTTPPPGTSPLSIYTSSRPMKKTAHALLRDTRRTSAEAWNLIGILSETQDNDFKTALRCYECAIKWAGTSPANIDSKQTAYDTLEPDWLVFWNNYTRVKHLLDQLIKP